MSETFQRVKALVEAGDARISEHGYDELAADGLAAREVVAGLADGAVVEDYPDYKKGPCVLVLQKDQKGRPVHAVWGIPRGNDRPAVLVTAYIPEPSRWSNDFTKRQT